MCRTTVLLLFVAVSAHAIEVRPYKEPSPAVTCLRAAAEGRLSADVVRSSIEKALSSPAKSVERDRLHDVLDQMMASDDRLSKIIEVGLDKAARASEEAKALREQLSSERAREAQAVRPESNPPKPWFRDDTTPIETPSREDLYLSRPILHARLFRYVDGFLDRDPDRRIQEAFAAAGAEDCSSFLGGRALAACNEIGLSMLRYASLWIGVMDLRESRGNERVISRYLKLDSKTAERALIVGHVSSDDALTGWARLIERWREKPPNRWGAWADVEALIN